MSNCLTKFVTTESDISHITQPINGHLYSQCYRVRGYTCCLFWKRYTSLINQLSDDGEMLVVLVIAFMDSMYHCLNIGKIKGWAEALQRESSDRKCSRGSIIPSVWLFPHVVRGRLFLHPSISQSTSSTVPPAKYAKAANKATFFVPARQKNIWTTLLTFQNTILVTMPVKKQFHRGKISSNGGYSPNFVEHKDKTFRASIRRRTFSEFKLNKFVRLICVRYKASRDVESIRHWVSLCRIKWSCCLKLVDWT